MLGSVDVDLLRLTLSLINSLSQMRNLAYSLGLTMMTELRFSLSRWHI